MPCSMSLLEITWVGTNTSVTRSGGQAPVRWRSVVGRGWQPPIARRRQSSRGRLLGVGVASLEHRRDQPEGLTADGKPLDAQAELGAARQTESGYEDSDVESKDGYPTAR